MTTVPINNRYSVVVKGDGSLKRALSTNSSEASSVTLSRNSSQSSQRLALHCGHSKNYDLTFVPAKDPGSSCPPESPRFPPPPSLRNPQFSVARPSEQGDRLPTIQEVDPSRVGGAMDVLTGAFQEGLGRILFSTSLLQSGRRKRSEGRARMSAAKYIKLAHF